MTRLSTFSLALAGLLALSACDSGAGSDDITGSWSTTVGFQADTVLSDQNYRVLADYEATYTFELLNDDGLIYGRLTSSLAGTMTGREAGREAVLYEFDPQQTVSDYVFGTYDDPTLELDVPWGEYQDNLWTFDKVGGRAELKGSIVHEWEFETFHTLSPGPFRFTIDGDGTSVTTLRRDSNEAPELEDPSTIVPPDVVDGVHAYTSANGDASLNGVRVRRK